MRPARFGRARHAGRSAERTLEPVANTRVGGEIPGREIRRPPSFSFENREIGLDSVCVFACLFVFSNYFGL